VLWEDEYWLLGMRGECVRDAPEESAAHGASSALAADNQSGVEVLSSTSPSFGMATMNEPARASCIAAGVHTVNTTASAGST
jgi:hypothetical protein